MSEALTFRALARPAGKHPECMVDVIAVRGDRWQNHWTMTRAEARDLVRELQSAEAAFQAAEVLSQPLSPDPSPARGEGSEAAP